MTICKMATLLFSSFPLFGALFVRRFNLFSALVQRLHLCLLLTKSMLHSSIQSRRLLAHHYLGQIMSLLLLIGMKDNYIMRNKALIE